MTFQQSTAVHRQGQGHIDNSSSALLQQQVLGTGSPITSVQGNNTASSVESQTQQILRQIQETLRRSQASSTVAASSVPQTMAAKTLSLPTVVVKQEPQTSTFDHASDKFVPSVSVKTESSLERLIKQEDIKPALNIPGCSQTSSIHALLTNTGSLTQATTTLSQASTQMSLFVLSNSSQTVPSNSSVLSRTSLVNSSGTTHSASNVINSVDNASNRAQQVTGSATMQKIHLPPELQQPFQRVQQEIRKIQADTTMPAEQKQAKLMQLQSFQKRILLKGRVLATTKTEHGQIQQGLASLNQASSIPMATTEQTFLSAVEASQIPSSQAMTSISSFGSLLSTGQPAQSTVPSNLGNYLFLVKSFCFFLISVSYLKILCKTSVILKSMLFVTVMNIKLI